MEVNKSLKPPFSEVFFFWLKLGFISFGGPAGQISIMHTFLVEQKKWISESRFMHALNYCMLLPGPEAQQLATYIGWLLHGTKGGLAAGILFVLPSMFILLGLSIIYVTLGNIPEINALFNGLKPAVIAIIIHALFKIGRKSLHRPVHYVIAVSSFCLIYFLNISFPYIVLGAALLAMIFRFAGFDKIQKEENVKQLADENMQYQDTLQVPQFSFSHLLKQLAVAIMLWVIPFCYFIFYSGNELFWKELIYFFTKAAFVTFGGAYAVLPYVAQESVEKLQWLSNYQMLDGLALGETTPGPLIMVLAFVGFMAGYNYFSGSVVMGTLGLITTTWYTFLPCFLFIFAGAPLIEKSRHIYEIRSILSFITAAVVGVIFNLSVYLSKAVVFTDPVSLNTINYFSLTWIIVSFVALIKWKVNIILLIVLSALAGLGKYLLIGY